jgi:hypothetical protein
LSKLFFVKNKKRSALTLKIKEVFRIIEKESKK